jgi:hypothetical protein
MINQHAYTRCVFVYVRKERKIMYLRPHINKPAWWVPIRTVFGKRKSLSGPRRNSNSGWWDILYTHTRAVCENHCLNIHMAKYDNSGKDTGLLKLFSSTTAYYPFSSYPALSLQLSLNIKITTNTIIVVFTI